MMQRIKSMLVKESRQILRDPRMRTVIFVAPVIQLLVFGYAATTDVRHVALAVYDLDNSVASRELIDRFVKSGYFETVARVEDDAQARDVVDRGRAAAVLRLNRGFAAELGSQRTAEAQLILDGTDSNTTAIVLNYASAIVADFSQQVQLTRWRRLQGAALMPAPMELRARAWFNENLESRNFYVPGVMANLIMIICLMLTSMAVVREKEIGTIEQVMVTPIRPMEFILGKTAPFALIGFIVMLLITVVGVFWFDVPIRGSLLVLLLGTALYLLTALGGGLLISTICTTQQQAMMSTFFVVFPAILLSGFIFPIANMPPAVQWMTYLNPLRYYLIVVRGVFLKGIGLDILWPQMVGLAVLGVGALIVAAGRFRKTLA